MAAMTKNVFSILFFMAFAGLGSAQQNKDCANVDEVKILSKMVTCITRDHPEYFLTVLTKMNNPAAMESPDFVCSNPGMMTAMVQCFLEYVEGCMPPSVAGQVASIMPTKDTVRRGIKFLCAHRKDFDDQCVESKIGALVQCFNDKMKAFTSVTSSLGASNNMQAVLCSALKMEEQCLATSLADCQATVRSDLMTALLAFFPGENCHITVEGIDDTLQFRSEQFQ